MTDLPRWGAALLLLSLAACNNSNSNLAQGTVPQPMPAAITASAQDQAFIQGAASSDQFEIRSSQLALQRSRNAGVRAFAQAVIGDHMTSAQTLSAIASAKGITAPGTLDPAQEQVMAQLQGAGRTFDREYWRVQATSHAAAEAAFQTEIESGYDADITAFAQQALPVIQRHLAQARRMAPR